MDRTGTTALILITAACVATAAAAPALESPGQAPATASAAPKNVWDGAFTDAQAARGQERYRTACSACHSEDLLGAAGPALVGQAFVDRWTGSTAFDIVQTIRQTMPQEAPDSLGVPAYVDIASYILKSNGAAAGAEEMPADNEALRRILVPSRGPSR